MSAVVKRRTGRVLLARKERTASSGAAGMEAPFNVAAGEVVLADLDAFTVTSRGRPYKVRVYIPQLTHSVGAAGATIARLREITGLSNPTAAQGNSQATTTVEAVRNGGGGAAVLMANIPAEPAGTQRTFRVTGRAATGSTGTSSANADAGVAVGKAFIEAEQQG